MATAERIREIIDFATTDAYGDDEVMAGWGVAFEDAATAPLHAHGAREAGDRTWPSTPTRATASAVKSGERA